MSGSVKAMVVGFTADAMRGLTHELRAAGHHVLGAVGKQGAWTFLRAAAWDVVLVPRGADGERARSWVDELGLGLAVIAVPEGPEALAWLGRYLSGHPPEPPPEPTPEPAPAPDPEASPPEPEPPPLPEVVAAEGLVSPTTRKRRRPEVRSDSEGESREPHPDLVSKLAVVRFGDYHSILEVEPHASPYAVREQRERLAHRFSPRGWPGRLTPEEIDMLDEIARGIADAFLILGTPELAARYERALAQSPSRSATAHTEDQGRLRR